MAWSQMTKARWRRKARLAQELEGAGGTVLSDELLLLDADRGNQGTWRRLVAGDEVVGVARGVGSSGALALPI